MSELTKVILEGPMGKAFGRTWRFVINSPAEALRMVEANKPGLKGWIKSNLQKYSRYRVICEYDDGRKEEIDNDSFGLERKLKSVRFVPLIEGASAAARIVAGIIIMIFAWWAGPAAAGLLSASAQTAAYGIGASLVIGGIAQLLAPKADKNSSTSDSKTSHYFDGAANTTGQGVPVPLIYGKCLVGSAPVSAALTIDQLI